MTTMTEVGLHEEASQRASIPGMTVETLEYKIEHYNERLMQLQSTNAPLSVIQPVARLQRIFSLALQMKRSQA